MSDIHDACRRGVLATVELLVSQDASLVDSDDQHDWRPIFHASLGRHEQIVRYLIAQGTDLAAHDGYVLHYAAEVPNNQTIVTLLVQYGALDAHVRPQDDLSRQYLTALFLDDLSRLKSLTERHPHLAHALDGMGDLPIHHAARNGQLEIVRMLIAAGCDVNALSERGHTILYCAAGHGHADVVQLLIDHGVDVHAKFTDDKITILQWLRQFPDHDGLQAVAKLIERAA